MSEVQPSPIEGQGEAMPSVTIPDQLSRNHYGIIWFQIDTQAGPINVEVWGRGHDVWCTGEAATVIAYGLTRPEWLPGLPGNNATAQRVVFEPGGPRLLVGNQTGQKRPKKSTRIIVEAWGFIKRTVRVRIPRTDMQVEQVKRWIEREDQREAEQEAWRGAGAVSLRSEGNVVYLRPRA